MVALREHLLYLHWFTGQKATDNPEDTRESIKNRSSSADLLSSSMKISPVVPNKKYRRVIIQEDDSSDENIEF